MDNLKNKKIQGFAMAVIGFIMILMNALDYVFGWDYFSSSIGAIGLVFVAVGMGLARKAKSGII
jgi:hypothetical protein